MSFKALLAQRVAEAAALLEGAENQFSNVGGGAKLRARLRAELRFLRRVESGELRAKESHLHSSNLTHLSAIVAAARGIGGVEALLHVVTYTDAGGRRRSLTVDVVGGGGLTWVKAVGRKAEALHHIWRGRGQYGERSVEAQAVHFLQASQQLQVQQRPPQVVFAFYGGVSRAMAAKLRGMGVCVLGEEVEVEDEEGAEWEELEDDDDDDDDDEEEEEDEEQDEDEGAWGKEAEERDEAAAAAGGAEAPHPAPAVVLSCSLPVLRFPSPPPPPSSPPINLDVSSLLTLVSSLSHGSCHFRFREFALTEQAAAERRAPVLPPLLALMEGRRLLACRAAIADFQTILDTLGGPTERERARQLLQRLQAVEDQPSPRSLRLAPSAKVTRRSVLIFGTGDQLGAVTVTANGSFVRAAANQGVHYSVHVHEPRALTEGKEWRATPL